MLATKFELDDVAVNLVDGFGMHDMRWYKAYGEPFLRPADPPVLVKDVGGLHPHRRNNGAGAAGLLIRTWRTH